MSEPSAGSMAWRHCIVETPWRFATSPRCRPEQEDAALPRSNEGATQDDEEVATVYGDLETKTFFVRMKLAGLRGAVDQPPGLLDPFRASLGLSWKTHHTARPMKVLVAVSRRCAK